MDWIMIPLNCLIVFGTIYKVVELFVRKRERLMLISKLTEISNVDFKGINLYSSGNKFTALRIGWLMFGVGLGFLAGFLINMMATYGNMPTTSTVYGASMTMWPEWSTSPVSVSSGGGGC
jgi:hypothetical protein